MSAWNSGWGLKRDRSSGTESFRITNVKVMDGAINAEMFNQINKDDERPKRPVVSAGLNGDELLKTVVDYKFMEGFNEEGSEAVTVMRNNSFVPLGIAADAADGNADTIYMLISERNVSLPGTPYMSTDIINRMTAVLAEKESRELPVRLVRVESSVVNRVIDFIYYNIEIGRADPIDPPDPNLKPLSIDVQPASSCRRGPGFARR